MRGIETRYKGYRFRSRLEARWAVFMDCLGIEYLYEDEGFVLPNGKQYLPDFKVPAWKSYLEVKPAHPSTEEIRKLWELVQDTGWFGLILYGDVWPGAHGIALIKPEDDWVRATCLIPPYNQFGQCRRCEGTCLLMEDEWGGGAWRAIGEHTCGDHERWPLTGDSAPRIMNAYQTARGARFEFKEAPKIEVLPAHRGG
jgi:hypothetical protein